MVLKKIFSYRTKLILLVNVFFWLLVFVFVTIQYSREREFRVELLDTRLQTYNSVLIQAIEEKGKLTNEIVNDLIPDKSLRVTVVDKDGKVIFENNESQAIENHKNRPEIQTALKKGHGYVIRRLSQVKNQEYFYSATSANGVVVRSALPYNVELINVLQSDLGYFGILLTVTIIINLILYFALSRFSLGIKLLRDVAEKAKNDDISDFDTNQFSNDELGEVSNAIVNIYKELKFTAEERDKSVRNALFEENEKLRIKHQLTSNINHELKTPVHAIRGCFETLLENELPQETVKHLLDAGYNNVMRLSNLLEDVSLITRITDDKSSLEVETVDVNEVVSKILKDVEQCRLDNMMRIHYDIPKTVVVEGNNCLIDAIFRNLINNALSYSGGRDIFIAMIQEDDNAYTFDVYDNGSGVEEKHLGRIFERFYRIDEGRSRKAGGTGLGLSIVRNAVQFHGGTIKAMNRKFGGLEFVFTLLKG